MIYTRDENQLTVSDRMSSRLHISPYSACFSKAAIQSGSVNYEASLTDHRQREREREIRVY
jgi:hypothetical protein